VALEKPREPGMWKYKKPTAVLTVRVKKWKRPLAKSCHAQSIANGMNGKNGANVIQNVVQESKQRSEPSKLKLRMVESHVKVPQWKPRTARTNHALSIAK
jgi:hypothetical protein